jgi:hypothetical protein
MSVLSRWGLGTAAPRNTIAAEESVTLPPPETEGGVPLMQALARRPSTCDFSPYQIPPQQLSNLLWAADGVYRTAEDAQLPVQREVDIYVALAQGLFRYLPSVHALYPVLANDLRGATGMRDFVDEAPVDLVFVADEARMEAVAPAVRETYAAAMAGAIAQNVYLYCASAGLAAVVRAWIDRDGLAQVMRLDDRQHIMLAQAVGYPA